MEKIFLFDSDGTILDSLKVVYESFLEVAPDYGLDEIDTREKLRELYKDNIYQAFVKKGLPIDKVVEFIDNWRKPVEKRADEIYPFDGMKEVIEKLSKKGKVFVITSNMTSTVEKNLKIRNIKGIISVIGGDKEPSKVKKIGMFRKDFPRADIYYIGDTTGDIIEGKKAGVKTVGVTWGYHDREILEKSEPDFIADSPEELLSILG